MLRAQLASGAPRQCSHLLRPHRPYRLIRPGISLVALCLPTWRASTPSRAHRGNHFSALRRTHSARLVPVRQPSNWFKGCSIEMVKP